LLTIFKIIHEVPVVLLWIGNSPAFTLLSYCRANKNIALLDVRERARMSKKDAMTKVKCEIIN
jgi:hypothetical protein